MTNQIAIEKWLEGVKNAALYFRPVIYKTNAIPSKANILSALKTLSRLTCFDGFIDENIEGMYAQQVRYAIEHMNRYTWNVSQCRAAMNAITDTLSTYLHYDPAIGNGVKYQAKCFYKTLKAVDQAYEANKNAVPAHEMTVSVQKKIIPCCLTPYYKHTVIKDPTAPQSFRYPKTNKRQADEHANASFMRHDEDINV